MNTFVGHAWRLRDATSNVLYKEFIPTSPAAVEVSIP